MAHAEAQVTRSATAVCSFLFLIVTPMLMPTAKEPPGLSRKTMPDRMAPIVYRNVASSPLVNLPLMVTSAGYMTRPPGTRL